MNRRDTILRQIVPEVVPSAYPDRKFRRIDAGYEAGKAYTTCGGLPAFVARALGVLPQAANDGLTIGGLGGMRNAGIKQGAWVHHDMALRSIAKGLGLSNTMRLPKPGDFYMLCSGDRHDPGCNCICPVKQEEYHLNKGAKIEHVGIIVSTNGPIWRTADAGQPNGNAQCAIYVDRQFDPETGFMTGEAEAARVGKPMRRLCGWLDVDLYPFADTYTPGAG